MPRYTIPMLRSAQQAIMAVTWLAGPERVTDLLQKIVANPTGHNRNVAARGDAHMSGICLRTLPGAPAVGLAYVVSGDDVVLLAGGARNHVPGQAGRAWMSLRDVPGGPGWGAAASRSPMPCYVPSDLTGIPYAVRRDVNLVLKTHARGWIEAGTAEGVSEIHLPESTGLSAASVQFDAARLMLIHVGARVQDGGLIPVMTEVGDGIGAFAARTLRRFGPALG